MTDRAQTLLNELRLASPTPVEYRRTELVESDHFTRQTLEYEGLEGDQISGFLFMPRGTDLVGGVVIFHQHNGEFHLGKSEVAGDFGDPLQAFGPALASRGVAVLAPDAITFEDRRGAVRGTEPDDGDWLQHYNAMAYRLVNGDVLMRKCLDDAHRALSVLGGHLRIDQTRVGVFGHSYGGTTALYHAAVDSRCRFVCVSGALASLEARQRNQTGINMFELVPGIATRLDAHDLVQWIVPRPMFILSATEDPYSVDADRIARRVGSTAIRELRVDGGHPLDRARFDAIVDWLVQAASHRSKDA